MSDRRTFLKELTAIITAAAGSKDLLAEKKKEFEELVPRDVLHVEYSDNPANYDDLNGPTVCFTQPYIKRRQDG